jgi:hypothetical protein
LEGMGNRVSSSRKRSSDLTNLNYSRVNPYLHTNTNLQLVSGKIMKVVAKHLKKGPEMRYVTVEEKLPNIN